MRKYIFTTALLCNLTSVAWGQQVQRISNGIKATTQGMDIEVQFYSPSIVRVFKTPEGEKYKKESLSVTLKPEVVNLKVEEKGNLTTVSSDKIQAEFNTQTGGINFRTTEGKQLLLDKDYGTSFTPKEDAGTPSYTVRSGFILDKDEAIYSFGQIQDGKFNRRGDSQFLKNESMYTTSPYYLSSKGYGLFWDNYSPTQFTDNKQGLSFSSLGKCADYYLMYGGNADGVIADIRKLSGQSPMLPLWAFGFMQSKERYKTQQEGLDVLEKYRALKVPIDVLIQDWQYWGPDSNWNAQTFNPETFPKPKEWVDKIHKLNAKLLIVTWPGFGPLTPQYKEFKEKNMLLKFDTWPPNSGTKPYDAYNPEARDIFWNYLNKGIFSYIGNDGWWLDSTEPDHINVKDKDFDQPCYFGSYRSVKNAFSLEHNRGLYEHQRATTSKKRVVLLTRSGFFGQQRYGSNTWSSDVTSSWEMLGKQIPAALGYSLMGIPNWNSDIGGFFAGRWNHDGGAKNPGFQELYLRWMQFATFCPMMRSHGTDIPREIWNFGKKGDWCYDGQEKFINLRYRLLPYIYGTQWDVTKNSGTFMRALLMDFSADPKTKELSNEFLFGRNLLVAPITKGGATEWSVYLPKGADWYDFWTNEKINGGTNVTKATPKDIIPLYVKAGTILPWGPKVQYSTEKSWKSLEIKLYPGANAQFTLYEDEFDNYNYEQGAYSEIPMTWDEATRTLTIGTRKGSYKGMSTKRSFTIKIQGDHKKNRTISYNGKAVSVRF